VGAPAQLPGVPAWSEPWRDQEGLARGGTKDGAGAGGGFTTTLRDPGGALGVGPASPEELPSAEPIVPESNEVARKRVQGRVQGFAESFKAHARAEIPDVYWRNMRQELERGFEVPYEVYSGGPTGGRSAANRLVQQYTADASGYGKTGNPFAGDPNAPGAPRSLQADAMAQSLQAHGFSEVTLGQAEMMGRAMDAATADQLVARILVSQREDGTLADVALVSASGNMAYDRIALTRARTLLGKELQKLGPLPREGRKSLWAFETDFRIIPPMPVAGCQLDSYFVPRDCFYPLQKKTRSRVRLEALY
jgi:hypothetical protein